MVRILVVPSNVLVELRKHILKQISERIKSRQIHYQSAGKLIEKEVTDEIVKFFEGNKNISLKTFNIPTGKNAFPDITVKFGYRKNIYKIFLEIKSAVSSQDPQNDLGTLRSIWEQHILKDIEIENLPNLFMMFVKYSKTEGGIVNKIDDVYLYHYFKFIGTKNPNPQIEILSYRKKDGNLRPKKWSEINKIRSPFLSNIELRTFIVRFFSTIAFRSLDIVKEHSEILKRFYNIDYLSEFKIAKTGIKVSEINEEIRHNLNNILKIKEKDVSRSFSVISKFKKISR
ncbi:MAG: hypothetical protein QXF55_00315 [Candidatus Aenigmatarchaeota archaeon]